MRWHSIPILTSRASLLTDASAALIASEVVQLLKRRMLSSESLVLVPSAPDDRLSIVDWDRHDRGR